MPALPRLLPTLATALLCVGAQAQSVMKPGGWRMDSHISIREGEGMPKDMGSQSHTVCLSSEALAREPYLSASVDNDKARTRGASCTTSDYQRQGDAASWTMQCELADGASARARIRNQASAELLTLEMVQQVRRGDHHATITIRGRGHHVGECTADMSTP
jgi:hypothetical protein